MKAGDDMGKKNTETAGQRTDPRIVRTKRLIEQAFLSVLEEKNFESLSVQDITERAGINRVTFYAHYCDKFILLAELLRRYFETELDKYGLLGSSRQPGSLHRLGLAVCSFVSEMHAHCRPPHEQLDWILEKQVKDLTAETLGTWLDLRFDRTSGTRSTRRAELRLELITATVASVFYELALQWHRGPQDQQLDGFVQAAMPVIEAILASQAGAHST